MNIKMISCHQILVQFGDVLLMTLLNTNSILLQVAVANTWYALKFCNCETVIYMNILKGYDVNHELLALEFIKLLRNYVFLLFFQQLLNATNDWKNFLSICLSKTTLHFSSSSAKCKSSADKCLVKSFRIPGSYLT